MNTDYWQKFTESGKVEDYLRYRNSIHNTHLSGDKNEQSDTDNNRNSNKRDKDQRK